METLNDFINTLFNLYPYKGPQSEVFAQKQHYINTLNDEFKKEKKYDFDKLLRLVAKDYLFKNTPAIPNILEHISKSEIIPEKENVNVGGLIRITCENGITIDLTVCDNLGNDLELAKYKIQECYGKIKKVETFEKGTVIIGNTVWLPDGTNYKLQS